jgi:hypothetical protein
MELQNLIKTGPICRAQRIILYGPESAGKTTLAAKFPSPLIIDTEDGSVHQNVTRISALTEEPFFEAMRVLSSTQHSYKTIVIDTMDSVEQFIRERVLRAHRMRHIEDFGYGRGHTYVREEFNKFLTGCLDRFILAGIHVVVISHSVVKRAQPPGLSDAFDRYELRLDAGNAARLKQWSDALLFLFWDMRTVENAEGRVHGVGGKERVIHTSHTAAYDAKNRVNLPEKLPCEFSALFPLFGNSDVSRSLPEAGKGHPDKQPEATGEAPGQDNGVRGVDDGAVNANAETPQQRLAAALNGEDPELIRLFLLNRKVCSDGLIQSAPEDYANRALGNLPRFRERLAKFATQPF